MVGSSKKAISGSSIFSKACRREITSSALRESPPRSKKFSWGLISCRSNTSAQTRSTAAWELRNGEEPFLLDGATSFTSKSLLMTEASPFCLFRSDQHPLPRKSVRRLAPDNPSCPELSAVGVGQSQPRWHP